MKDERKIDALADFIAKQAYASQVSVLFFVSTPLLTLRAVDVEAQSYTQQRKATSVVASLCP